ncbi:MAG: glutamate--tRNA ligase [Candidatus Eiseniibacteriota bacterium]
MSGATRRPPARGIPHPVAVADDVAEAAASTVQVRFAPSPTGRLHVGNARVALINWLFARQQGGGFLLRLDDTDNERSSDIFAADIELDLRWLGLDWDGYARQSERLGRYAAAAERLKAEGRLYPCYETPEELELKRKIALSRGLPPIYDRAALRRGEAERAALEAQGRKPHWRFKLDDGPIAWDDLVRGPQQFDAAKLSDPVLVRADGRPLYTLSSVVDDVEFAISHVIRGEDHVANTAVQIQIWQALGGAVPAFAHLPLLADEQGEGLSKRAGSLSLGALREEGIEPMALVSLLAHIGTSEAITAHQSLWELVEGFDFGRFGRATPKFDPAELKQLNARVLHAMPFKGAHPRLGALGVKDADERFWFAIRGNIERLEDAVDWWRVCRGPMMPVIDDKAFADEAARHLPPEPWDEATWGAWTEAVKAATGRKGRELFGPLRLALTGRDHGPELKNLLPLIGRARAAARLGGKTA